VKCPHCGKKIGPRKLGHVCTQFENVSEDGMGPFRIRFCKKCGQQWNRIDGEWRKVPNVPVRRGTPSPQVAGSALDRKGD
jgi:NMD protein affecting ribosome stability and mRNA decay